MMPNYFVFCEGDTEGEVNPKCRTQPLLFIWKTRRGTEVRKRTMEGNAKLFTHCQLKEVFIKLKQVSGINRKLKKKIYIHR